MHNRQDGGHTTSEVMNMTEKELLYVEDALGHEQYFQAQCSETARQLQDAALRQCVQEMGKQHKQLFQNFYDLL